MTDQIRKSSTANTGGRQIKSNQMGAALPGGKYKSNQMPGAGRTNQIK
jgi:hypothetical protein